MATTRFQDASAVQATAEGPSFASQDHCRTVFDHVLDCITIADRSGRIEYVNTAACKTFGYQREELLRRPITDLLAPEALPRFEEARRKHDSAPEACTEWLSRRKDGSLFVAEVSVTTLQGGRVLRIGRDITPRKEAEAKLRQVQQMLEAFIDYAPAAIAMFDRKMRYLRSSREWRTATGLSEAPLAGRCHYDVFPNLPEDWKEAHRRGLAGEVVKSETEWMRPDGVPVRLRWQVHPWGDAGTETGGVIILFEDVTEARRLEAQLRNAQKMDAVGRLAGGVAHEFRNALCVILLQVDLARAAVAASSEAAEHLEALQKAARHAGTITENLLAFSRKRTFRPEAFALDSFVHELASIVRPLAGDHIRVDLACDTGDARVFFDPMQLEQVLINLVCNAVDAMSGEGVLTITTRRDGPGCRPGSEGARNHVVLSVGDTGCGIPSESLPHIFEPFYTTKEVGKGTGLGLSISYGIVTQGGGAIEVESIPGKGTRFDVFLPLHEDM